MRVPTQSPRSSLSEQQSLCLIEGRASGASSLAAAAAYEPTQPTHPTTALATQARRTREMRNQLRFEDDNGMTLPMLAARSGSPVIAQSVLDEVVRCQVRLSPGTHLPARVGGGG